MSLKSPCIDICVFDKPSGLCIGCMRTKGETKGWKKLSESEQEDIVAEHDRRRKKLIRSGVDMDAGKRKKKKKKS